MRMVQPQRTFVFSLASFECTGGFFGQMITRYLLGMTADTKAMRIPTFIGPHLTAETALPLHKFRSMLRASLFVGISIRNAFIT
jgi:hypothetical protein